MPRFHAEPSRSRVNSKCQWRFTIRGIHSVDPRSMRQFCLLGYLTLTMAALIGKGLVRTRLLLVQYNSKNFSKDFVVFRWRDYLIELIDASGNDLPDIGCVAFATAPDKNSSIQTIRLEGDGKISGEQRTQIDTALLELGNVSISSSALA
jgi:hypothetical protein